MSEATNKFYNMQVNLINKGRICAEKAAIRNIWQKDDNIFLDIYIHRLNKSFIFASSFIHSMLDISRDKAYNNVSEFIADFYAKDETETKSAKSQKGKGILSAIADDIVILSFMAGIYGKRTAVKDKIIIDYIQKTVEAANNFSEAYLCKYIAAFTPDTKDFYAALKNIKSKEPKQAESLVREIIKICLVEGWLHYEERLYLAEILQMLRQEGFVISKNII